MDLSTLLLRRGRRRRPNEVKKSTVLGMPSGPAVAQGGLMTWGKSRARAPVAWLVAGLLLAVALALAPSAPSVRSAGTSASAAAAPGSATLVVDRGSLSFTPSTVSLR